MPTCKSQAIQQLSAVSGQSRLPNVAPIFIDLRPELPRICQEFTEYPETLFADRDGKHVSEQLVSRSLPDGLRNSSIRISPESMGGSFFGASSPHLLSGNRRSGPHKRRVLATRNSTLLGDQPTRPSQFRAFEMTSENGLLESKLGSRGSPSTRSPIPFRCISLVPAAMEVIRPFR
jgi:hypothetical protein